MLEEAFYEARFFLDIFFGLGITSLIKGQNLGRL
jgi:hypothetical protein